MLQNVCSKNVKLKKTKTGWGTVDTTKFKKNSRLNPGLGDGRMGYKGHLGNNKQFDMDYGLCHNTVSNYNVNFSDFYNMMLHDRMPIFLGNTELSEGKGKLCL